MTFLRDWLLKQDVWQDTTNVTRSLPGRFKPLFVWFCQENWRNMRCPKEPRQSPNTTQPSKFATSQSLKNDQKKHFLKRKGKRTIWPNLLFFWRTETKSNSIFLFFFWKKQQKVFFKHHSTFQQKKKKSFSYSNFHCLLFTFYSIVMVATVKVCLGLLSLVKPTNSFSFSRP